MFTPFFGCRQVVNQNKQNLFFGHPKTAGNSQRVLISMLPGNGSAARMDVRVARLDRELAGQQR
jgi:hypothetical protein